MSLVETEIFFAPYISVSFAESSQRVNYFEFQIRFGWGPPTTNNRSSGPGDNSGMISPCPPSEGTHYLHVRLRALLIVKISVLCTVVLIATSWWNSNNNNNNVYRHSCSFSCCPNKWHDFYQSDEQAQRRAHHHHNHHEENQPAGPQLKNQLEK